MRSIQRPKKCYVPKLGQLLWWEDRFLPYSKKLVEKKQIVPISMMGVDTWHVLTDYLSILSKFWVQEEFKRITYRCPWFGHTYCAVMPIAILSDNVAKFYPKKFKSRFNMIFDQDWVRQHYMVKKSIFVNELTEMQLGHGYTESTLPDDGGNSKIDLFLDIGEGDRIIVRTWEWYNK